MDHLCGRLILTIRQQSSSTLHDVTLPKSWLSRVVPDAKALQSKERQLSSLYKKNMGDLLEQIYTGTDAGKSIGARISRTITNLTDFFAYSTSLVRESRPFQSRTSSEEHLLRSHVCCHCTSEDDTHTDHRPMYRCRNLCLCKSQNSAVSSRVQSFVHVVCAGGYNLRSWELRNDISRAIGLVRKPGRTYNALIEE